MRTAILIPSLNRPQLLARLIDNIGRSTPEPHYIYLMVSDDESVSIARKAGVDYHDDSWREDRRYVTRMNQMVHELRTDTGWVFFGSDDVDFKPGWLGNALRVGESLNKAVIVGNDLRNRNGTMALMRTDYLSRSVYDEPGNAFYSGYMHNFADTEQFDTATLQGEFARAMHSEVEHLNPVFRHSRSIPYDPTYALSDHGKEQDRALYLQRKPLVVEWANNRSKENE